MQITEPAERRCDGQTIAILIYFLGWVIGLGVFLSSPPRSVSHYYEDAATRWLQSESLYDESKKSGGGFIYLPHAALLHVPYAVVSQLSGWNLAGDVLWRTFSWGIFAAAAFVLASRINPCLPNLAFWPAYKVLPPQPPVDSEPTSSGGSVHWRVALVTTLLGLSCLRIGQSTLLMTALMLFSLDCWHRDRFRTASTLAILAVCVKPLAIVLPMLYFATIARTRVWLVVATTIALATPFAMQSPGYVAQQYIDCLSMLRSAADLGSEPVWAQFFGMLSRFGIEFPHQLRNPVRLVAALGVLAAVWATRRMPKISSLTWTFTWCCVYLMLFNPRTENSTYAMLGPVYGVFIGIMHYRSRYATAWALFVGVILTMGSYEIGKQFTPQGMSATWLAPLCCCGFAIWLAYEFARQLKQQSSQLSAQISSGTRIQSLPAATSEA